MQMAKAEAKTCFGDDEIYMEKLSFSRATSKFSFFATRYGHVVHLGDRDCSVQRRNQKIIEEASSPFMTEELRMQMGEAAVCLARKIRLYGSWYNRISGGCRTHFYFMEMNTKFRSSIRSAKRSPGSTSYRNRSAQPPENFSATRRESIVFKGHAIECRINAEDPEHDFRPVREPREASRPRGQGVRIDSAVYQGYRSRRYYDSRLRRSLSGRRPERKPSYA
jgi:acetyl-CoA carboxylase biotin carboxylase subunit